MREPSGLRVDLSRVEANFAALRRVAAPARFCAVVKADCYGLGAVPIARRLATRGVDMLGVYSLDQARSLVIAAIEVPILTLGVVDQIDDDDPAAAAARRGQLHVTIHSPEQLHVVDQTAARLGVRLAVHPHLDTGMSRGGLSEAQFREVCCHPPAHVRIAGISTHMASSDDDPLFTAEQFERLDRALRDCRGALSADVVVHAANTATLLRDRRYHLGMVRIGLGIYGYGPELLAGEPYLRDAPPLLPAARWWSRLQHIGRFPRGAAVGYNRTHILQRDSALGVAPVGYADGYSLALGNKGIVDLPAHRASAPIVGKVNMDQIIFDLTDIPAARVGDEVVLYSDDPASPCAVPKLAKLASSNCYEMLTRVSHRISREYVG